MATYVATNVQNFPSPNQDTGGLLVVQAFLSESVADGGLIFSAFTGVQADFFQALGESRSGSGVSTTQTQTVAHPGPITVNGGALAFGVTLSIPSASVGMFPQAEAFQRIEGTSDLVMAVETDYALPDATRPVDPQWTWFYDSQTSGCSPSTPCTWLASALALNPGNVPPPPPPPPAPPPPPPPPPNQPPIAAFTPSCNALACTFTSTSSDPDGFISSYSWDFGDGARSADQSPSHTYSGAGTYHVALTVTDDQGATNATSLDVTVTQPNQPPTVNAGSDETVLTGLYTESVAFTDPDNDGPWLYTIDWGDGTSTTGSRPSQGSFSVGHTYLALMQTFTIRVTVTDSHGASG